MVVMCVLTLHKDLLFFVVAIMTMTILLLPFRCDALILLSWILLVFGSAKDQPATDEPVRVFVIAGQSNGEGKGSIKMLSDLLNDELTRSTYQHLVMKTVISSPVQM